MQPGRDAVCPAVFTSPSPTLKWPIVEIAYSLAGPGGWPAWFYRASPSQSGSKELGQLSNFAKAAPFFFPRCYNKYTHWRGGKASVHAVRGTHVSCKRNSKGIL